MEWGGAGCVCVVVLVVVVVVCVVVVGGKHVEGHTFSSFFFAFSDRGIQ